MDLNSGSSGSASWTYDARGRMASERKTITDSGTFLTQWTYNSADLPVTMIYPGNNTGGAGETVTTTYLPQGLVNTVIGTETYVAGTKYDAAGRPLERVYKNSSWKTTWTYYGWADAQGGRLQTLATTNDLQNLTYTYDLNGNITQIVDATTRNNPNHQTQTFGYDALNRLTSAQRSGGDGNGTYALENYTYDANTGNLATKAGTSYAYGTQSGDCPEGALSKPHAVVTAGTNTYCYDQNGNMRKRTFPGTPTKTYVLTYDAENRLTGVSGDATAAFAYDGDGRRVRGTVNGTPIAYLGSYAEYTPGMISVYYYAGGVLLGRRNNSDPFNYILGDHLGSVSIVASGNTFNLGSERRYKAWGEMNYSTGSVSNAGFSFTGQRRQAELELLFYQARWYDPALGRFLQADSIIPQPFDPISFDHYIYCGNNPLNRIDPNGHVYQDPNDNQTHAVRPTYLVTFDVDPDHPQEWTSDEEWAIITQSNNCALIYSETINRQRVDDFFSGKTNIISWISAYDAFMAVHGDLLRFTRSSVLQNGFAAETHSKNWITVYNLNGDSNKD
jgi:RHS repeat-associated protein